MLRTLRADGLVSGDVMWILTDRCHFFNKVKSWFLSASRSKLMHRQHRNDDLHVSFTEVGQMSPRPHFYVMESAGWGGGGWWEASSQSLPLNSWLSVSSAALQTRHTARNPAWLFPWLIHHVNDFSSVHIWVIIFGFSPFILNDTHFVGHYPWSSVVRTTAGSLQNHTTAQMSPVKLLMSNIRPSGDRLCLWSWKTSSDLVWWGEPSAVPTRTSWWWCRCSPAQTGLVKLMWLSMDPDTGTDTVRDYFKHKR